MDENGGCNGAAFNLEDVIDFPQTLSELNKGNLERFKEEARELLSYKDTYLWARNESGLYVSLLEGPFRFQGFRKKFSEKREDDLSLRSNRGEEHSISINPKYKPEYAFLHERANGKEIIGFCLSTTQEIQKPILYLVKKYSDS